MIKSSPWSIPPDPQLLFPLNSYEQLLEAINCPEPFAWLKQWDQRGGVDLASYAWHPGMKKDWLWGIGLPFLSDIERFLRIKSQRTLFGISGLPGCGKTTFGKWLEAAAAQLNWSLKVVSLDDFYLPSQELEKAMFGNPWGVPRALPGSHSIQLLKESIDIWRNTGNLKAPKFDKALRNGLGDRCGWSHSNPQILVIEGWFLGCELASKKITLMDDSLVDSESISPLEKEYQAIVQSALEKYQSIWDEFERIWHLKAVDFTSTKEWKTEQEINLQNERGASLKGKTLELFHRMIETAIPIEDLQSVRSDVVVKLNSSREIIWVGPRKYQP